MPLELFVGGFNESGDWDRVRGTLSTREIVTECADGHKSKIYSVATNDRLISAHYRSTKENYDKNIDNFEDFIKTF